MSLNAQTINGFQGSVLASRYDKPKPTPDFHIDLWEWFCDPAQLGAAAAPRGHAKSTAITHVGILSAALFREAQNIMILSDTEDQGIQFLTDIKLEIQENDDLREMFHINYFIKETEKQIIVSVGEDKHQFRVFVKGAGKSLRGSKWRSKRPDLIVGDDMENDEMVMNPERRLKLKQWLLKALIPMLSDEGKIRIVGTVLHADSLLEYCLGSKMWLTKRWKAHNATFSKILWPEKFPKERLLGIKAVFDEAGESDGYAQEYLNEPIDEAKSLFKRYDFLPIKKDEVGDHLEYYIGVDLAISQKTTADYTVYSVLGINKAGKKRVVDIRRGRMDTLGIIEEFFVLWDRYKPQFFVFEDENINKALAPILYSEMEKRGVFPLIETIKPAKDKIVRARPLIAAMRSGQVQFDTEAFWFQELLIEFLKFPRGKKDDQVDSLGSVFLKLHQLYEAEATPTKEEEIEDEFEGFYEQYFEYEDGDSWDQGRSSITGY